MKKRIPTLLLFFLSIFFVQSAQAALPDGTIAPDWTLTDLDGNSHNLYDVLDQGKMVILDFSATWCPPCWSYHQSGVLETLYNDYGPSGTDELMVFLIEPDQSTNIACLYGPSGCVGGTMGDWVTGTPYPIINTPNGTVGSQYNITYYPTMYAVCPNKKIYEPGQVGINTWLTWLQTCQFDGSATSSNVNCYGDGSGSVDLTTTGGYGSISYSWSNGASTEDLSGIEAGNYSVTVTEGHGHSIELGPFEITGPSSALEINTNALVEVDCFGAENGSIDVSASGGNPGGYTYSWSNGAGSPQIYNLGPGNYTLEVSDVNSCTQTETFTISEPPLLVLSSTFLDENCDNADGEIIAQGSGGSPSYIYDIGFGPETSGYFGGLSSGVYDLTITDNNGCEEYETIFIDNIPAPFADAGVDQNIDCSTPQLTLDGSGSDTGPNIAYQWTTIDGNIVSGETSLYPVIDAVGEYELMAYDVFNGCFTTATTLVFGDVTTPLSDAGPGGFINCANASTILDGSSSSSGAGFTYLWTTTNGNIVSGENTLTPTVDGVGDYVLLVTDTGNSCTAESSTTVVADFAAPTADAGADGILDCATTQIQLDGSNSSGGANFIHVWTTANGNIVSGDSTTTPTVDQAGTYTLVVTNTSNGCTSTAEATVTANIVAPIATVNTPGILNCTNSTQLLDGSGSSSGANITYLWTTTNGNIASGGDTNMATIDQPGTYTLQVSNTANGCISTIDVTVTQDLAAPTASAGSAGSLTCNTTSLALDGSASSSGSNFSYLWTTPDGNIVSGATTTTPTIDQTGTYTILVTNSTNGCTATASVVITANTTAPTADAGVNGILNCDLTQLTLNGNNSSSGTGITYLWTTTNGNIVSGDDTTTPVVDQAGTYTLTVSNATNGCTATSSTTVSIDLATPTADAGSNGLLNCVTNQLNLDGSNSSTGVIYSYAWSTPDGNIVEGADELDPLINEAGTYILIVTNTTNGCTAQSSTTVSEDLMEPIADAGNSAELNCIVDELSLNGNNSSGGSNISYSWSTSDGNIVSGDDTTTPLVDEAGTYTLIVTNTSNGCTSTSSTTVTENMILPTADAGNSEELNCNTTLITLDGTDSSTGGNFSYLWTSPNGNIVSGATTLTPTVDEAGDYELMVTNNANGCTSTSDVSITEAPELELEVDSVNDVDCNGEATGSATIAADGGNGPYTYNWPGGAEGASQNNLEAGTYTASVTDDDGCLETVVVTIDEPSMLNSNASSTNETAAGANDGTATANPSGGSPGYSYEWSNGATSASISDLEPGLYTVIITDANGCTLEETVTVNSFLCNVSANISSTNVSCFNGNDGTATASMQGGTGPYTYSWSNGATTATITGLPAGTYEVIINDNSNCPASTSITISEPLAISLELQSATPVDCAGNANGAATVQGSGGTGSFSYAWSTGDSGDTATGLEAGAYTVIATDANGCTETLNIEVTEPTALGLTTTASDETAAGANDGMATANPSGGVPPYSYSWSNGATTAIITGLAPDTYTVIVTDANGCEQTSTVTVNNVACAINLEFDVVQVNCAEGANGMIETSVNGATEPYSYSWSNGATTSTIQNLTAGTYTLIFMDGNGCEVSTAIQVVEPLAIQTSTAATPATCNGSNDGSISLQVTGGTAPYTFQWSDGSNNCDIPPGSPAGTYSCTVTDSNGCTHTLTEDILQPEVLLSNLSATGESSSGANDGAATAAPSGGTSPYTYLWNTGATTASINNLAPGTYSVDITDANGCTSSGSVIVSGFDCFVQMTLTGTNVTCNGVSDGTASIGNITGASGPFTYNWSNGATTESVSGLPAGAYTLEITDGNGCPAVAEIIITEPDPISISSSVTNISCAGQNDGFIDLFVTGGTGAYTYFWSDGSTLPYCPNPAPGTNTVQVTDMNGCVETYFVEVTEPAPLTSTATTELAGCNGAATGQVDLEIEGGIGSYTYLWSNGAITQDLIDVPANEYTCLISDANGCELSIAVTVDEASGIEIDIVSQTNVQCASDNTGTATADANGGSGTLTYSWSNGDSGPVSTGLSAGVHTVTATDDIGCMSTQTVEILATDDTAPTALTQDVTVLLDATGNATVDPAAINAGSSDNCELDNMELSNSTFDCSQVGENIITLTVTDAAGNAGTATATVTVIDNSPPTMECTADIVSNACVEVIEYDLPVATDNCDIASVELIVGLGSGNVFPIGTSVEVYQATDINGNSSTCSFTITVESDLEASILEIQNACFGENNGTAIAGASGGNPDYTYEWSDGQTTEVAENLSPGTYSVVVTDAGGCTSESTVIILENTEIIGMLDALTNETGDQADGAIDITAEGGNGAYTYSWTSDNGFTSDEEDISGLSAGMYTCLITDANGCTTEIGPFEVSSVTSTINPELDQFINLYPNPSDGQVHLQLNLPESKATQVIIFDVTGRLILNTDTETTSQKLFSFDLSQQANGVYLVKIIVDEEVLTKRLVLNKQ